MWAHEGKNKSSPLWKHSFGHHKGVKQWYSFKVLKSHRSALSRQISEAVLIQVAGPDMLLNSRGEWNICKILRLILDDEEPIEDWLSVRSKCKNICKGQEPSSIGSGGEDGDGGESGGNKSVGVESVSWKGSKAKKSRLIVPLH